uniref:Uncharacterized protein n=1 Tax=Arundo donax TaxID=35708 RepID=A0A0A9DVF7_ARUDO
MILAALLNQCIDSKCKCNFTLFHSNFQCSLVLCKVSASRISSCEYFNL